MNFVRIKDKNIWMDFLDKVLFRTFFHDPEWENFLEKEFSWIKFEHYIWKDELLLSIARCKLFGKEKLISHPLCEYGGPLPLKEKVDFESFEKDFIQEFGRKARIQFHPYILSGSDPDSIGRSTFLIESFSKKTSQDLWKTFRKTLRQEIRKGEQHNIVIGEFSAEEDLKKFYNLYLDTIKRHKTVPIPFSVMKFLSAHAKIFLAKRGNVVIGGSVFLLYKPFIHYFINASDYKYRDWNIGHKILWHVMQDYAGKKYDYFDLGGTRKGSALEVFKKGWGAKEYSIYEINSHDTNRIASWKRNIRSMLPAAIIKRAARHALYWTV